MTETSSYECIKCIDPNILFMKDGNKICSVEDIPAES